MGMLTYQALLSNPDNIRRIRAARRDVERMGGRVEIGAPNIAGMVLVLLHLPDTLPPEQIFPGIPFYPA
ncbi:MAG TPA: hypothetical protein VIG30_16140 [Ktedonobacterales bacterium]|jgi:hypothetical protein